MKSIAEQLAGFKVEQKPEILPAAQRTPKSQKEKVVLNPVRQPINRQAALIMRPERDWIAQPTPDAPKTDYQKRSEELAALLKVERNDHASTKDELGRTRTRLKEVNRKFTELHKQLLQAHRKIDEQADIIRQLEYIKL